MGGNLVPPHGGRLLPLLVVGEERQEGLEEAKIVPRVRLSSKEASDLIMLAMGAFVTIIYKKAKQQVSGLC